MMYYAKIDNQLGSTSTIPEGAVEITRERYGELLDAQDNGDIVTIVDGKTVTYTSPVYSPDGTERNERDPSEPLITQKPPESLHVPQWQNGEWIEAETDEQRAEREQKEADEERQHLNAMTATRFQAKATLDDAGLLDQVEAYMAGDDVPKRVKLAWEEASFRRGSKMIQNIGEELGLSEEQIDNLFIAAQEIEA